MARACARDDLLSAETLLAYQDRGWSIVAFHAQQGAEKALKAVLVAHNLPVPKTHDLLLLAGRLPVGTRDVDVNDLKRLNPWVVGGRYPGDIPEANRDDAAELLDSARRVLGIAEELAAEVFERGTAQDSHHPE